MDASLMANEVALSGYRSPTQLPVHEEEPPLLAAEDQDGPEQFDFHQSFGVMTGRRLQRRYRGVYQKYSFVTQLVTWIIVVYIIVVFAVLAANNSASRDTKASVSDGAFYFAIIVLALYLLVKLALLVRWIIYWIIIAELLTYAITGSLYVLFWIDDDEVTDSDRQVRHVVIILLVSAEIITVFAYWFTHYAYPWLVLRQKLNLVEWWNVKPGVETNSITYRSKARFYSRKRNVVKYCGGLNAQGQPHGFGMWTDTAYHGERLTGQWEDGVPVGPFRSFEYGSGYSFVNIRIGFCHNRGEKGPTEIFFFPKHSDNGLNWGVASVECSVSGGFFKYLPTVTHLTPSYVDESPQSAAECLPALRTPTDGVVFNHKEEEEAVHRQPRRERLKRRNLYREESAPVLDLPSIGVDDGKEALVLLHGYNCSLDYGMNRLAQLLALGDFPSYIHPYVFSWPSGGVLAYFQAKGVGSESERTADDFILFLKSLIDAGYTKLNIIAHSMGARVFFSILNKGLLEEVLLPTGSHTNVATATRKLELSTLTFCNPDYDRNDFVKYGGGYDRARHFCSHITLFADSMDGALFYLEYLSKKTVTGPLNYSLGRRGHMIHRDPEENDVAGRSDTQFLNWQNKNLAAPQDLDLAYAAVNQRANYPGVASFAYNRSRTHPTNDESAPYGTTRGGDTDEDAPLHYLDMDVIDTTWMDNNVHAIRHNYFNLNPTIVDDLRHLIVLKKRASSRPGLLKTTSAENVYIFLVAPSHVKNK
ncbi:hypothetical protein PR003_g6218 [Phytophthora rubi]|uniref:Uncharacterized protein n=1 Tax=Phytophthora rubi TaxID=129364 RepID=A0A6A3NP51_9STRA|nr:hypothetical protein PR002_g6397 [Phytophthora rubi]KAE9045227.1 hypothetical protein PR001_g5056 [Phytophthora rubi]KAE9348816.1 hypothetical protein PR003_g6218 [Phytophthora rubi]